ncbi:MAG: hypothetical protein AMXMBFR64_09160 [Myxococcales bacterium]
MTTESGLSGVGGDAGFLEALTFAVFATGFDERIVRRRWDAMCAAFEGFRVERVAAFDEEDVEGLLGAAGVIRNRAKVGATVRNAAVVAALAGEHGSAREWLGAMADDPVTRRVALASRFERVGPRAAETFLALLPGA